MNRNTPFNHPLMLGFDQLEHLLENISRSGDNFPPYDIEEKVDGSLVISLAVAGFSKDMLSVTREGRQLLVRGRQDKTEDREFIHRGIAARQFQRKFLLADGMVVQGASLKNGLLHIQLLRPEDDEEPEIIRID